MIAWLRGIVLEIDENEIIIDTNGVGYRVTVGDNLKFQRNVSLDQELELPIYTAVKEDGIKLYGFNDFYTRKVFISLLGVSGIGPKVALNIVDQIGISDILNSISSGNPATFTKVSGVGKKTAQRIILDLQGKLDVLHFQGHFENETGDHEASEGQTQILADAISALSNLGFSANDAEKTIIRHLTPQSTLNEILRKCLMDLRQGV
jgi:Holliday junction DNA helicase RuvA